MKKTSIGSKNQVQGVTILMSRMANVLVQKVCIHKVTKAIKYAFLTLGAITNFIPPSQDEFGKLKSPQINIFGAGYLSQPVLLQAFRLQA